MIALDAIIPVLRELTGLWAGKEDEATKAHPLGWVQVSVFGAANLGQTDETTMVEGTPLAEGEPSPTPPVRARVKSQREATLRIKVTRFSHKDGRTAWDTLDWLTAQLSLSEVRTRFQAAGLFPRGMLALTPLSVTWDERVRSCAILDLRCGYVTQVEGSDMATIETTEAQGNGTAT